MGHTTCIEGDGKSLTEIPMGHKALTQLSGGWHSVAMSVHQQLASIPFQQLLSISQLLRFLWTAQFLYGLYRQVFLGIFNGLF